MELTPATFRMIHRIAYVLVLALACITATAAAQDPGRTLHWRRLDVDARLDADGRLHVRERQAIIFTGNWNGGERTFNIRAGQRLDFHGMTRIDSSGAARQLDSGDLDVVDRFAWTDATTLRWRSRLPGDPPFDNHEIVYQLDYTFSNILTANGDEYLLDHDFAFPSRSGAIDTFVLTFNAANVWRSAPPLPLRLERANIAPGASVVVTLPLRYTGGGTPAGIERGVPLGVRLLLALMFASIVGRMLRTFFAKEKARGRFEPLTPVEVIDRAWLRAHVFSMPPEVVGALWDSTTSTPEVAAMIARMVQEGKLASRIESAKWKHVLHLELKVPRSELGEYERRLTDALFATDDDTTDTNRIKERYRKSGFAPAALVGEGIQKQIRALTPSRTSRGTHARVRNVLINVAVVLVVAVASVTPFVLGAGSSITLAPFSVAFIGIAALVLAGVYRQSVVETKQKARQMTMLLLLPAALVLALVLGIFERGAMLSLTPVIAPAQISVPFNVALIVMYLGIAFLVLRAACTGGDRERLEMRRTLAAGRAFFIHELRQTHPALDDAWYPYLLAFGLGKDVDRWFRGFGALTRNAAISTSAGIAGATASAGGWSGGGPLFGGGGGFGGGGAGRAWASSVETLSAGVSAPSSGGSGSGGGGSSGGGGGGGW